MGGSCRSHDDSISPIANDWEIHISRRSTAMNTSPPTVTHLSRPVARVVIVVVAVEVTVVPVVMVDVGVDEPVEVTLAVAVLEKVLVTEDVPVVLPVDDAELTRVEVCEVVALDVKEDVAVLVLLEATEDVNVLETVVDSDEVAVLVIELVAVLEAVDDTVDEALDRVQPENSPCAKASTIPFMSAAIEPHVGSAISNSPLMSQEKLTFSKKVNSRRACESSAMAGDGNPLPHSLTLVSATAVPPKACPVTHSNPVSGPLLLHCRSRRFRWYIWVPHESRIVTYRVCPPKSVHSNRPVSAVVTVVVTVELSDSVTVVLALDVAVLVMVEVNEVVRVVVTEVASVVEAVDEMEVVPVEDAEVDRVLDAVLAPLLVPVVVTVLLCVADAVVLSVEETDVVAVEEAEDVSEAEAVDESDEVAEDVADTVAVLVADVVPDVVAEVVCDVDSVVEGDVTSHSTFRPASDSRSATLRTAAVSVHTFNDSVVYRTLTKGRHVKVSDAFRLAPVKRDISSEIVLIAAAALLHAPAVFTKKRPSCSKQPRLKSAPKSLHPDSIVLNLFTASVHEAPPMLSRTFSLDPAELGRQPKNVSGPRTSSLTASMETASGVNVDSAVLPARSVTRRRRWAVGTAGAVMDTKHRSMEVTKTRTAAASVASILISMRVA